MTVESAVNALVNANKHLTLVEITDAAYAALSSKDAHTIYKTETSKVYLGAIQLSN